MYTKLLAYFPQLTSSHTTRSPPVEQITQNVCKEANKERDWIKTIEKFTDRELHVLKFC